MLTVLFTAFSLLITIYFVLWSLMQLIMGPIAAVFIWRHQSRHTARARALVDRLAAPPRVSIIVPAFNEELTVVQTVRGLLALDYEAEEIVVINDGSTDRTLQLLREAFQLVPAPFALTDELQSKPIREVYRSIGEPTLIVVDKENGRGKSDAVNAGINAASGSLVLIMDADTVVAPDAISRGVLSFLEDPDTVAVGGNVAIVNGCRVEDGQITNVSLPASWLASFQVIEYMRSFLLLRLACASGNAVFLISGAFGLFRRDALIAIGGFDATSTAEDMDVTLRLQRHFRAQGKPIRIGFDPNPMVWTQAPEDLASLRSQRTRWRRGLLEVLWRQRGMFGNPRYGIIGLGALPYVAFFEGLGPVLEMAGYVVATVGVVLGILDWRYWGLMVVVMLVSGSAATLLAVIISDLATRQYTRSRTFWSVVLVILFEHFGYLQLKAFWGCVGTVQMITGKQGWGPMKRRAF